MRILRSETHPRRPGVLRAGHAPSADDELETLHALLRALAVAVQRIERYEVANRLFRHAHAMRCEGRLAEPVYRSVLAAIDRATAAER